MLQGHMNQNPYGFNATVKATLRPTAEARNSDLIKDKLYSPKINPQPEGKRSCMLKVLHSSKIGQKQFY